jgi:hypothetical protein
MRRTRWIAPLLVVWPMLAGAEQVITRREWNAQTAPSGAQLQIGALRGANTLRVEGTDQHATQVALWALDAPRINRPAHALRGEVQYHDVSGVGYFEMWTWYGNEHYFSRSLAAEGPLRSLSGSSDWRPFALPFFGEEGRHPTRIEVNLVLPGAGRVELSGLTLVDLDGPQDLFAGATGAWWDDRTGGFVGGALGSTLGVLGALIGALSALGRARALVTALNAALVAIGGIALVAGLCALLAAQPYAVYYPLLLAGAIGLGVGLAVFRVVRQRYQEIELRRMAALDAS